MSTTTVRPLVVIAVPILRVSARVVFEKGRGWSAIDELILWALSRRPRSAGTLAEEIDLPRRVVLEVILRMMRFRLVEAVLIEGVPAFRATIFGNRIVQGGDEIPTLKKKLSRKVAFVVDQLTGAVFPKREVRVENEAGLRRFRDNGADVRIITVTGGSLRANPGEMILRFETILNADETLIYFDSDTLIERDDEYMLVTLDGADLRGLPVGAPAALLQQINGIGRAPLIHPLIS